jgi:hypothetical protein
MSDIVASCATPWVISEGFAGLRTQALGLAEAAGLTPEVRVLAPGAPWKWIAAKFWPNPLAAVAEAVKAPLPGLAIGCGGMAGAVLASLRRQSSGAQSRGGQSLRVVQVQNPRMDIRRFDLIVANTHDELTGPNVFVTRTALHRVTPQRLAAEADLWRDRFAGQLRPLVAVLLGGSNGRYTLDRRVGAKLAAELAGMAGRDNVGAVRRLGVGLHRREPVFRHAGARRHDRCHAGQRLDDLRGGRHRGSGDVRRLAGIVAATGDLSEDHDERGPDSPFRRPLRTLAGVAPERHAGCRGRDAPPAGTVGISV